MMNKKLIEKRLNTTRFISNILSRLPFIRCIILNGSLASGNHKNSSDIDILIIAKDGHIFTARFFVNFLATIFKIKRSKGDEKGHAGKFCFNYFLTESYLKINFPKERESYCAQNYSNSRYIAGNYSLFEKFLEENKNLFVLHRCHPEALAEGSKILRSAQNDRTVIQIIAESVFGDWFEKWAKNYQIKKIESDPITKKYPEVIIYNNREMRFHPPK